MKHERVTGTLRGDLEAAYRGSTRDTSDVMLLVKAPDYNLWGESLTEYHKAQELEYWQERFAQLDKVEPVYEPAFHERHPHIAGFMAFHPGATMALVIIVATAAVPIAVQVSLWVGPLVIWLWGGFGVFSTISIAVIGLVALWVWFCSAFLTDE